MPGIIDDKSEHCIPFILERLKAHQERYKSQSEIPPFFIGLNGVQGAGKTTLVSTLCSTLTSEPYNLPTVVLSIDDLYLPHDEQVALAESNPNNPLVQHRGQPSTHDVELGTRVFSALRHRQSNVKIPSYDKSAFNGQGDRTNPSQWHEVNMDSTAKKVDVVVFEGWCVGFRPVSENELEIKWRDAVNAAKDPAAGYKGRLGKLQFESIKFVNDALKRYEEMTNQLDAFMHIDAADPQYVYQWRLQQEAAMRDSKGMGMTDEQVVHFVDGYYPAYEVYTDVLRRGIYSESGRQLRLLVGQDRRVREIYRI